MKLHIVNPNATASMTETIRLAATAVALPSTTIIASTGSGAPASIEGYADEAAALPGMLAANAEAEASGVNAHIIACFDDPGLDAAREIARVPVLGICQSGIQVAMMVAKRFSIVTTLPRSVPIIEDLVASYGGAAHCRRVRSASLPVLALEDDACRAEDAIARQIEAARDEDGAEAILLGCAGMADLVAALTRRTGVPVIDGVAAAVKLAEAVAGAGFVTSKLGAYATPRPKSGSLLGRSPGRPQALRNSE